MSGAQDFVMHMGHGCFKGRGWLIDNTTCSKDPEEYEHQECQIQACKSQQRSQNDPACHTTVKGLFDIICSLGIYETKNNNCKD